MLAMNDISLTHDAILLYVVSATIFIIAFMLAVYAVQNRRQRLNWYEQNLLEIANTSPQYVRCRAVSRLDTEDEQSVLELDEREEPACEYRSPSLNHSMHKQSRIQKLQTTSVRAIPSGDLSEAFTVPRFQRGISSMFRNPDQSQIDRCLYQTTMDAESEYDDESCGSGGSIKVALSFDVNLGLLTVVLRQAVDLVAKRQDGYPNPRFQVTLDVPESTEPKVQQHSKIYKNTNSPVIEEAFYFQVPNGTLNQCRLEIMVFDFDQFSVDECIGYCWLTLGRLSVSSNKETPTVFFAEVLPFDDDTGHGFGEVLLSLSYLSKAQRLTVNVFKARNLPIENCDHLSSIAIRIALVSCEKRLKRKKTASKKNTGNPQFNESLCFAIPKHTLCDSVLEIEAVHEYGTFGMGCKALGRMELPLHKCRDLWRSIIHEEKSQARWYSLEEP